MVIPEIFLYSKDKCQDQLVMRKGGEKTQNCRIYQKPTLVITTFILLKCVRRLGVFGIEVVLGVEG